MKHELKFDGKHGNLEDKTSEVSIHYRCTYLMSKLDEATLEKYMTKHGLGEDVTVQLYLIDKLDHPNKEEVVKKYFQEYSNNEKPIKNFIEWYSNLIKIL